MGPPASPSAPVGDGRGSKRGWPISARLAGAVLVFTLLGGWGWLQHIGAFADGDFDQLTGLEDAASVDCDSLAAEAVRISTSEDVQLLKVRDPRVTTDNRATVTPASGNGESLILSCRGLRVWSSGDNTPALVRVNVDSDGDNWIYYTATG